MGLAAELQLRITLFLCCVCVCVCDLRFAICDAASQEIPQGHLIHAVVFFRIVQLSRKGERG